ncbi:MAG: hypothetical protein AB7T63_13370 [Planctomycetota bacterium]
MSLGAKLVLPLLVGLLSITAGCGGGNGSSKSIQDPEVRNFSPFMSPIDFGSLLQNPTFTNSSLTATTDPNYPGQIVIFFQPQTEIDPRSVFIGGNPALGEVDPAAIQITQEVPGSGNFLIPIDVEVQPDRIICQPLPPYSTPDGSGGYITNMPQGQYTIGVLRNVRNVNGRQLQDAPVYHSFTVGDNDTLAPRVVTTKPIDGEINVGAGTPPPALPVGVPADSIADVTINIFGPTSPDILIRFSEGMAANSVTSTNFSVLDAGSLAQTILAPAPGFPKLKSQEDQATLPSNGHEVLWRADPFAGGFPFGTDIQMTVLGLWNDAASQAGNPGTPDNPSPLQDLSGNYMTLNHVFKFTTVAPPSLPQNPIPEYSIWWSASDRVGALDLINHKAIADQALGNATFPQGIPLNVLPEFTDTISTDANLPGFDPFELIVDPRNGFTATCHTYVYVQSVESSQVAIINTRNSIPVALINTPSPGGIGLSVADNSTDMLVATNTAANTFTAFGMGGVKVGQQFLTQPIFIVKVQATGNQPRAIAVSTPSRDRTVFGHATANRDATILGPVTPLIMWADFADGAVNTITLNSDTPLKTFGLGPSAAPNDISFGPCQGLMFAAISQGGLPGEGAVSYYASGPACSSGVQTPGQPDAIVGKTNEPGGLDAPDGLDQLAVPTFFDIYFYVAESGSSRNAVTALGLEPGQINLPRVVARFNNVGNNPNSIAHRAPWGTPSIGEVSFNDPNAPTNGTCNYQGLTLWQYYTTPVGIFPFADGTFDESLSLFVCARGSNQITQINALNGTRPLYNGFVPIPGVRWVGSQGSQ